MARSISDQLLARCGELITHRFGLHFPKKRWRDLERGIVNAATDLGFTDPEPYISRFVTGQLTKEQTEALLCRLTIGETYFFRERKSFEALQTHILPALLDSGRSGEKRVRIWCAGCSTGEEPYSVAMLLHRMVPNLAQWNVTILASDINPASLRKAALGEYGDWSFRDTPRWVKEKYFKTNREGRHVISGAIRKMVTFVQLNLAQDPFPSLANNTNAMDVIFCRNVMMYFAPDRMKEVIDKFHRCLVAGGWLIVSPCEASHALHAGLSTVRFDNSIFYRKDGNRQEKTAQLIDMSYSARIAETTRSAFQTPPLKKWESKGVPDAGAVESPPAPAYERRMETGPKSAGPELSPYEEALELYRRGDYAEAAAKLAGPLAEIPQGTDSPAFGEAAALLAQAFANKGNLTAALEWSEKAVAADRLNPLKYYLQATIFQERGDEEAAIVALKRAIYLDQGFVIAHFSLANLAMRRGRKKEAARHLENAASLLHAYGDDDILPGAEGMSARRLAEIIAATRNG